MPTSLTNPPFAMHGGLCRQGPESQHMWYRRTFSLPQGWPGQRVLLHFGAVDWHTNVWVNNIQVGSHSGGYVVASHMYLMSLSID